MLGDVRDHQTRPADAQAALDRMLEEAKEEGRDALASECNRLIAASRHDMETKLAEARAEGAAEEREACAVNVEHMAGASVRDIAARIRARGGKEG